VVLFKYRSETNCCIFSQATILLFEYGGFQSVHTGKTGHAEQRRRSWYKRVDGTVFMFCSALSGISKVKQLQFGTPA